ncbi:MAG: DUF5011 domain-containing protein [Acholeplasmataceae bacterium]|jgi:hypothetical protein|nr:DUF5011 domain-containing protein [Acholeplasmataceae bacterium]
MKRENLVLLINTAIMIVVGLLLLVVATQLVPSEPEDLLFNQVVTLKNKENIQPIPDDNMYMIVHAKEEAYNNTDELVGTVYTVLMKNTYGYSGPDDMNGYLELLVGIDLNDRVSVEIVELVQSNWTISGIQRYIKTIMQNVPISEVASIEAYDATNTDLMSGMTATNTTNWIKEMVLAAIDFHENGIPQFPFLYGASAMVSVERDDEFDPLAGITAYDYQDGDLTEDITVVGYETVNLSVSGDYTYTIQVTDSENNQTSLIVTLTVVGAEIQLFDEAFGNGYVSVKDESFVPTATVLEKYDVTFGDDPIGYIYVLQGTTMYNVEEGSSGSIQVLAAISLDNILLGVELPRETYNHTKQPFYYDGSNGSVAFAKSLIGTSLNDIATEGPDLITGPSRSKLLVVELLDDLKEVLLG